MSGEIGNQMDNLTQKQQVIEAMKKNGGYATLQQLYHCIDFSAWGTMTPQASVRQIVQMNGEFFNVFPGLWALKECEKKVREKFSIQENKEDSEKAKDFTHSYYQGLIVELGNMHKFKTYVPNQDKNQLFHEKPLSELVTEKDLPPFTYEEIAKRAKTVDVIWFNERKMPYRFYEIEHTTDISHSLGKFCALRDFRAEFYIIAHESKHRRFDFLIQDEQYKVIKEYVKFFDYNSLEKQYEVECSLARMDRRL